MPSQLNRAEHRQYLYRYISNEYRRLAGEDCSNKTRCYYLQMAESYCTLAATAELTTESPLPAT